jgi:hypothetical protein
VAAGAEQISAVVPPFTLDRTTAADAWQKVVWRCDKVTGTHWNGDA